MLPEQKEILVDYLDNQLQGEERLGAAQMLQEDSAAAEELQRLRFSVALVREAALFEQVKAARDEFYTAAKVVPMQKKESGAVVRSFSKNVLRVAAMLLLFAGAGSVYKYSVTNASSVFDDNYTSFELSTSRGVNTDGALEQAYRDKNWNQVANLASVETEKTNKTRFLAGVAAMELKDYNKANRLFSEIIQANRNSNEPLFQDEAEYYLAMADLAGGKTADGLRMVKAIRADKTHLFYRKASAISTLDLQLLELKK